MYQDILYKMIMGNRVMDYFISVGIFFACLFSVLLLNYIVIRRLEFLAKKTTTSMDDFIVRQLNKNVIPLLYFGSFALSTKYLNVQARIDEFINMLAVGLFIFFGTKMLLETINYVIEQYFTKRRGVSKDDSGVKGFIFTIKTVVIGIAAFLVLDNLGVKISALIAGLGIGGIAVALAAQSVLADVFSFVTILFDRPFETGDFIIVDDYLGTVEHIGLKTTKIRSLGGEQLIFSNTMLTNSKIKNYKRMEKRRVVFKLGLTYQTKADGLKTAVKTVEEVIKNVKDTIFDRAHFHSYGDFSLNIEVVYHVLGSDYNKYMDIQQEINLKIKEEFEKQNLEFAYPTQTVFVSK
ncbi:mechanosensitive ion channel family protein [Elusimicrobiota bacterium]